MSEARVQEEWMFEEGIHERRLEAVPLAGSLAVHDEVHHAHGEAISDALLVASKQHDQKARARVPLDARTLDISHYNDFINYSENFRLLNSAQEKVLGKIVQNGLSAADEVKNARDNNVQPHATLLRAVANGEKAQEQFFNANLRLVVSVAGGYARNPLARGVLRMDLIQYGMFGLKRAIEKFDPTRGFKFFRGICWYRTNPVSIAMVLTAFERVRVAITNAGRRQGARNDRAAAMLASRNRSARCVKFFLLS